jgi:uncharacterized membrane protein YfcA
MSKRSAARVAAISLLCLPVLAVAAEAVAGAAGATPTAAAGASWWLWPLGLFAVCFGLGMVAVPAGVGGGVLFVPIVSGFFPFHLDFVRGAGLLVALASALSAGPSLLRAELAHLRLGLPLALLASITSIFGAMLGLALPASIVQTALGVTILGIVVLMATAKATDAPVTGHRDRLAELLGMHGVYVDAATGRDVPWRVHRTIPGLVVFSAIGMLAGMFGLGAGWANVPTLNLLMGAPLKVSAGTSSFILSLVDSSAAWVYLNKGAVLPVIAVPSVLGMMLGARVGVKLLKVLPAATIRKLVIAMLLVAGGRALLKGLGVWS